jgi:hypothetical protein
MMGNFFGLRYRRAKVACCWWHKVVWKLKAAFLSMKDPSMIEDL